MKTNDANTPAPTPEASGDIAATHGLGARPTAPLVPALDVSIYPCPTLARLKETAKHHGFETAEAVIGRAVQAFELPAGSEGERTHWLTPTEKSLLETRLARSREARAVQAALKALGPEGCLE